MDAPKLALTKGFEWAIDNESSIGDGCSESQIPLVEISESRALKKQVVCGKRKQHNA